MTSLNDLIKESRKIEIRAKGLVDDNLSGEYKTAFKGRGIDFHDLREYLHGDEVRSIDWNTTARTGDPYVKQFVEQRELSIYLAIDITKSINYGSINKSRHHLAALITTVLSLSAARNGDRVGFIFFSDKIKWFGNLPLDFSYKSDSTRFYAPIGSMILLSVDLSIVANIFYRFF